MLDKEIDQKEAEELKKVYEHYLEKRIESLKIASFKVEVVFGDITSNGNFGREQITKLNIFLTKIL